MGNYHPHGDQAIYLPWFMAQPWAIRDTLVEGQGNFGSVEGSTRIHALYRRRDDPPGIRPDG